MAEPQSQEVVERSPAQAIATQIRSEEFQQQLAAALPEGVSAERFARVAVTALMEDESKTRDPSKRIVAADRGSLFQAIIKCAQDGLLPDGREAALVKRGEKVSYMPMIGGFRKIAADHGWTLRTHAVFENDEFEFTVEPPTITHRPARIGTDRGQVVASYAVARHRDGRREQVVIPAAELAKRRAMATTQDVWNKWEPQQAEKTAGRDLFAELPMDPADKERITRVLYADQIDPAEATRALYGGPSAPALNASPTADGAVSQQASDAPSPPGDAPEATGDTTTPVDGGDGTEDGYNQPDGQDTDPVVAAAREAALMVPPSGQHALAGRTLEEILILGEPGVKWFELALGKTDLPEPFQAALRAFARVHLPEMYKQASFDDQIEF